MRTRNWTLALAGAVVMGWGIDARAQIIYGDVGYYAAPYYHGYPGYWYGAGSTAQGDILRGMGAHAIGEGIYLRESAVAEAIHERTAARLFLLQEGYIRQQDLRYHQKRAGALVRNAAYHARREEQLLNHPEARDVNLGDSLNRNLAQLVRLGDYLLLARESARPIPSRMVKEVPFQYTPTGKTIKLGRIQHEPIPYSFRRDVIGRDPARFRAFVRKLSESPRISAGELVLFMNGFGLRFGVADGAAGREAYARLQAQLSSVREAVMKRPGEPEEVAAQ